MVALHAAEWEGLGDGGVNKKYFFNIKITLYTVQSDTSIQKHKYINICHTKINIFFYSFPCTNSLSRVRPAGRPLDLEPQLAAGDAELLHGGVVGLRRGGGRGRRGDDALVLQGEQRERRGLCWHSRTRRLGMRNRHGQTVSARVQNYSEHSAAGGKVYNACDCYQAKSS